MKKKILTAFAIGLFISIAHSAIGDPQTSTVFKNPTHAGHRLDWCLKWGAECGEPAAKAWCQSKGFEGVSSFHIANDIGATASTIVFSSGAICNGPFCDGFADITCLWTPNKASFQGAVHVGPAVCDGYPEVQSWNGAMLDAGWAELRTIGNPAYFLNILDQCSTPVIASCDAGYQWAGQIHTGPGKCDEWPEGIDNRRRQISAGWVALCALPNTAYLMSDYEACVPRQLAHCKSGFMPAGRIHTGPGDCDGMPEGKDNNNVLLDRGWMTLCVREDVPARLVAGASDCDVQPQASCGAHNQLACDAGGCSTKQCNPGLTLYNNSCWACGVVGTQCCKDMSYPEPGGAKGTCIQGFCSVGGYCHQFPSY